MNDLRLILLVLGVIIVAGLYVRERLRNRKPSLSDGLDDEPDQQGYSGFRISTRAGGEEDYASVLSSLKKTPAADAPGAESLAGAEPGDREQGGDSDGTIITLHVMTDAGHPFTGPALRATVDDLGLVYGDMRIYHHYGIGDMKAERPLFHLANMLEPGYFDPDHMDDFQTLGVSLFMQLPTVLDAEVVFDLMLNTALRLAGHLGGEVVTHDRQPLTEDYIEGIRARLRGMD